MICVGRNIELSDNISLVLESDFLYSLNTETRSKNTSIEPFTYSLSDSPYSLLYHYYTINWPNLNSNGKANLYAIEFNFGLKYCF